MSHVVRKIDLNFGDRRCTCKEIYSGGFRFRVALFCKTNLLFTIRYNPVVDKYVVYNFRFGGKVKHVWYDMWAPIGLMWETERSDVRLTGYISGPNIDKDIIEPFLLECVQKLDHFTAVEKYGGSE